MNWLLQSFGIIWGTLCFIGWIIGITAWVRRGFEIPRAVHITSAALFLVGVLSVLIALHAGYRSTGFTVFAILGFPIWAYVGWFLVGCPPKEEKKKEGYDITHALSRDQK